MLRINLLPAYLAEQRKVRAAIVLSTLLFLVVSGVMLGYVFAILNPKVTQMQADEAEEKTKADAQAAYELATTAILTQIQPLQDKVDFIENVHFHNTIRQKIFQKAARYTYRKVEYDAMSVTGNILSMSATVSNIDDIGRYYLGMFANPDVSAVSFVGVPDRKTVLASQPVITPGGPPPAPPQYRIGMNATITHTVSPPVLPASLGASGGGGAGIGGPPAGLPPGAPGGAPIAGPPPGAQSTGHPD